VTSPETFVSVFERSWAAHLFELFVIGLHYGLDVRSRLFHPLLIQARDFGWNPCVLWEIIYVIFVSFFSLFFRVVFLECFTQVEILALRNVIDIGATDFTYPFRTAAVI